MYKVFQVLKEQKLAKKALVVCPLRPATETWPLEKEEWLEFQSLKVTVIHGAKKNDLIQEQSDIYVITPDALEWYTTKQKALGNKTPHQYLHPDILVVDESSKFKSTNSMRFRYIKPILASFKRRYTLTGSPAPNGYEDIFGQVYITDMGRSLGPYITHYRNEYFNSVGFGGYGYELKEGAEKLIHKAIAPTVYRVESEHYLDLPEFVPHPVYVDLPKFGRDIYDDMEKQFFALLDRGQVSTAVSGAVARGKCEQIANGGVYIDAVPGVSRQSKDIHTAKIDAVMELRDSIGGKQMLIAYDYQHDLSRLLKAMPKVPYIGGNVSSKRVRELIIEWNTGNLQELLGHPQSMGHGLNMQKSHCEHICWHSLTDNYDDFDQFNKRIRRQGNGASHVWLHLIIAKNTVDIPKWANLQSKGHTQRSLMDAIHAYRKSRAR